MSLVLYAPGVRSLPDRLGDLGRARRAAATAAGLFRLLAMLVASVVAAGLLDAALHLDPLPRAGLLVALLTAAGAGWLRLVRPAAREAVHPLAVALRLEAAFPRLNDALASAVEFGLSPGPDGLSRFQRVAHLRAENLADRLDLRAAVPARRAWWGFWLLLAAAGVAASLAAVSPPRATAAVLRLADPFGRHPWPTRTTVELIDAPTLLAEGDPYLLRFRVTGLVPESAAVSVRPAGGAPSSDAVPVPEGGEVSRPLDPGRVARDFDLRVTAGDADTGWTRVQVGPPPRLVPLGDRPSPRVSLSFPAYTGLPPADLPDGTGVVEGVAGSVVRFRAAADRPIRAALFRPQFDLVPFHAAAAVAPLAADSPLASLLAGELAPAFAADLPVRCDGTELAAEFVPPVPGLYALRFTDARGLTGTRLFDFRMFPDSSPVVTLDRPAAARDPLDLLPTARLPLAARAEDRPFAVRSLGVEYRVGGDDAPWRSLPLTDAAGAESLAGAAGGGACVQPVRPATMTAARTLPLAGFTRPDGRPSADGDVLTLRAAAADWDDRTALKGPGRSPEVVIRVLGRGSLEAKMQAELAALRPELLRMREELRAARDGLGDATVSKPTPEEAARVAAAEAGVRGVKARLDDPAAGTKAVAGRLDQTRAANNLPRSATTDKVQAAAAAARAAAEALDQAEANATPAGRAAERAAVEQAEREVGELLERLEQWGGAGEVRGEARTLNEQVGKVGEQADAAADPAARGRAADRLERAGDRAAGLLGKAGRLAVEKDAQAAGERAAAEAADQQAAGAGGAEADKLKGEAAGRRAKADQAAAEADALRKAVREAGGQAVPDDLRRAADELRRGRAGESAAARQAARDRLDKLAEPLAESSPTRTAAAPGPAAEAADTLAQQHDELRKKTKRAVADPARAADELPKLSAAADKLKKDAEALAERLTREKNEPAAAAARDAVKELGDAARQMQRGQDPAEKQAEAADKLDAVKDKLADKKPDPPAEGLTREQREQVVDRLKPLRDRQAAAVGEAVRVLAEAAAGRWDRPLLASLGDLEDRETALAGDLRPLVTGDLDKLPVFARLAAQAADAMTLAGKRAADRRDDAAAADGANPTADARLLQPMRAALRKLDTVLAAVAPDPADKPKPDQPAAAGGGAAGGGDGGPPPAGPGVSPLAQLKALRAMQAEVAEQTAAFADAHPDPDRLTPDERADLAALEQAQREVAELFGKLAAAFRPQEQP